MLRDGAVCGVCKALLRMRRFQVREGEDAGRAEEAVGDAGRREILPFFGDDVRKLGFWHHAQNNPSGWSGGASKSGWNKFYLHYYLSDRIQRQNRLDGVPSVKHLH